MDAAIRSRDELLAMGKARRKEAPRSDHARWCPPANRPSVLDLLAQSNAGRVAELLPLRYERMAASPFTFFRGLPLAMAHDVATGTPTSGLRVQACGDCHLENFGIFATPERNIIFDINDFDETLPAPWEWDLKRLCASLFVAGRGSGFAEDACRAIVRNAVRTYRDKISECSSMTAISVWYSRIHASEFVGDFDATAFDQATFDPEKPAPLGEHMEVAERFTEGTGVGQRIRENPPRLFHATADNEIISDARSLFERYRVSLRDDVELLLRRYSVIDLAVKVVGIGSVGTRCAIALLKASEDDALVLQIKEARRSILEPYAGASLYESHGQRIVVGQQLLQAASDMFLGWSFTDDGHEYYVRQLKDMKASMNISQADESTLKAYSALCAKALAIAHGRSGEPAAIAGYLGKSEVFADAIAEFAQAYALQVDRDYADFLEALQTHRI